MPTIDMKDITAGYGKADILHDVDFRMDRGDGIISIIGPNGAGKSTLLKTLMGYLKPNNGKIKYKRDDITNLPPHERVKRGITFVPQLSNVFPSLTVEENLVIGGYSLSKKKLKKRMAEVFEHFPKLKERRKQEASCLSGGERQMLALARAVMLDPDLLLLDEPSAALSPGMAEAVFQKVEEIRDAGASIIIVEQDAKRSLDISDRGYVLASGRNEFDDTPENILDNERIKEAYLGSQ
ncbi:ABC transporter ATP-binding protein [Desulfohalovibrio reitneri]|uniref:ABC transporter ATP-binding protein n=1 Tax=Desulfohalovibrio reitneri TaxID=1307759 RepID=UPI0004A7694F|nr:ABC transporter ATP-binding protein [Desulfohalovibrio reitneri]